jgi:hypothetical protein
MKVNMYDLVKPKHTCIYILSSVYFISRQMHVCTHAVLTTDMNSPTSLYILNTEKPH